jgi:hypothetical protein
VPAILDVQDFGQLVGELGVTGATDGDVSPDIPIGSKPEAGTGGSG